MICETSWGFVELPEALWNLLGPAWNLLERCSNFVALLKECLWNLQGCFQKSFRKAIACKTFEQNFEKLQKIRFQVFIFEARLVCDKLGLLDVDF